MSAVITINGKQYNTKARSLTYEEIARIAGLEGMPSMTCKTPDGRGFIVTHETFVAVVHGMTINAINTGAA